MILRPVLVCLRVVQWASEPFDGLRGIGAFLRWDPTGRRLWGPRYGLGCLGHYCSGLAAEGLGVEARVHRVKGDFGFLLS
jgi:hypothetical protein